jgi:anti-sigma factor RsiW
VSVAAARELNCNVIVELVTDNRDGALDAPTTSALEEHLRACPGCEVYVEQIRQTIAELGRVSSPDLSADTRAALLAAFRTFRRPDR